MAGYRGTNIYPKLFDEGQPNNRNGISPGMYQPSPQAPSPTTPGAPHQPVGSQKLPSISSITGYQPAHQGPQQYYQQLPVNHQPAHSSPPLIAPQMQHHQMHSPSHVSQHIPHVPPHPSLAGALPQQNHVQQAALPSSRPTMAISSLLADDVAPKRSDDSDTVAEGGTSEDEAGPGTVDSSQDPQYFAERDEFKEKIKDRLSHLVWLEGTFSARRRAATNQAALEKFQEIAIAQKKLATRELTAQAIQNVEAKEVANEEKRKESANASRRKRKSAVDGASADANGVSAEAGSAEPSAPANGSSDPSKRKSKRALKVKEPKLAKASPKRVREISGKDDPPLEANGNGAAAVDGDAEESTGNTAHPRSRRSKKEKDGVDKPKPKAKEKLKDENDADYLDSGIAATEVAPGSTLQAPSAVEKKPPSQKEIRALTRQYNNTYDSIWKDMARRDAAKVYKVYSTAHAVRESNVRKTAALVAKEARRWQIRTNKSTKDLQGRARRGMREMLSFWKRNEKEERDLRKKAEKEALDLAKKEEEYRESRRQSRKLNFLITQTELYSHFIGRKIDKGENADPSVTEANSTQVGTPDVPSMTVSGKRDIGDIDFDGSDDELLRAQAAANAQAAIDNAQSKAKTFNNDDIDEMNFQNPTSLGDLTIAQPKMLSCQLKEYQLKGLNWLANLYEQGINGILADEMGLGKTVQSISVMAYLAETHNIWGPYLVISPASTLHNWQQEITRFVPDFKVLPYWGSAKDRKVLRKFWDRKNVKYTKDSPFHVLVTSYQLVVADAQYFQRVKWQYMILDEAQAIKSSSSSRWKSLLSFQCRNRLLLTGTPIQNSMQELWALLHFIMPSLFDSHDEFSEWFSKDIESHAQNNSQLNEQQLKRLHMILKPFMLRRVKKHVQQELGDKIELDVYCTLTNRQKLLYRMLRSQISLIDLIEKAASNSDDGTQSLMNLVMQFRKVCNHPDLFERADVKSALNFASFGESVNTMRDGATLYETYSARNLINFTLPKEVYREFIYDSASDRKQLAMRRLGGIWNAEDLKNKGWVGVTGKSASQIRNSALTGPLEQLLTLEELRTNSTPKIAGTESTPALDELTSVGNKLLHSYETVTTGPPSVVSCPPINFDVSDQSAVNSFNDALFDQRVKSAFYPMSLDNEWDLVEHGIDPRKLPSNLFPHSPSPIRMPSMQKFITDSGKLSRLDSLLRELKKGDHRVLIYFQMTKMMDLMEEYLTFKQYKYCRLDGSSKLSERRDLVNDWQNNPELFVFLLSTRAGGLGINLTAADTVIFYDSDWNPTIDSQAMDRAHRLGQTKQVTVYRLLVKGTIEERMRDRAKQKMQVHNVVMEGGAGGDEASNIDFQKPGREVAYWLLEDDAMDSLTRHNDVLPANQLSADLLAKQNEEAALAAAANQNKKKRTMSMEDLYHEGEGEFEKSGTATPVRPVKKSRIEEL